MLDMYWQRAILVESVQGLEQWVISEAHAGYFRAARTQTLSAQVMSLAVQH